MWFNPTSGFSFLTKSDFSDKSALEVTVKSVRNKHAFKRRSEMITLKKDGFLVRYAYFLKNETIPGQMSLCKFFWRLVMMTLYYSTAGLMMGLILLFIALVLEAGGFFFASRLAIFEGDETKNLFTPYRRWPKLWGYRIVPAPVLLLGFLAYLGIHDPQGVANVGWFIGQLGMIFCLTIGVGLAFVLLGFLSSWIIRRVRKSEAWMVVREYIKSRKEKVCPIVHIVS